MSGIPPYHERVRTKRTEYVKKPLEEVLATHMSPLQIGIDYQKMKALVENRWVVTQENELVVRKEFFAPSQQYIANVSETDAPDYQITGGWIDPPLARIKLAHYAQRLEDMAERRNEQLAVLSNSEAIHPNIFAGYLRHLGVSWRYSNRS